MFESMRLRTITVNVAMKNRRYIRQMKTSPPEVESANHESAANRSARDRFRARPRLRAVLADDHEEIRARLREVIGVDHDVVGSFSTGQSLLDALEDLRPDIVLLDVSMPDMSGFEVARFLVENFPLLPIVFVTQHAGAAYVSEAFRLRVAGYVLKGRIVAELPAALRQIQDGGSYLSPSLQAAF
jgi:DNA-binding NarL/FixJ family response regulator